MTINHDKVDVLIVGSGARARRVAWSLADTRMRILCLEQGDWMKPTDFPSNGRDWEAGAAAISTSARTARARHRLSGQRRQLDHEGRQLQRRRRRHGDLHGALAAPAPVGLQGEVARRRRRRLADRLLGARAVLRGERPHDGRARPAGDPGVPPRHPPMPPIPLGKTGARYARR
jgi:choline dehydrogenase-like flavoprotein